MREGSGRAAGPPGGVEGQSPSRKPPKAWGETRYTWGTTPTTYRYTGQREQAELGLYYYGARWYDPYTARFTQPDTIVPDPEDPQQLNRFSYVGNNSLRYVDPSGHVLEGGTSPDDPYPTTGDEELTDEARRSLIYHYALKLQAQGGDSLESFALLIEYAASLYDQGVPDDITNFMLDTACVVVGYCSGNGSDMHRIGYGPGPDTENPYYVGQGAFPGKGGWADEYYDYEPNNQMFHFWFYVGLTYFEGPPVAYAADACHESPVAIGPCGGGGVSDQDRALSRQGIELGLELNVTASGVFDSGNLTLSQVGQWIREHLGQD